MRLARRMEQLGTESALSVGERVRELVAHGRDVIALHIGEPDLDTPSNVIEAACRALADGATRYPPPAGLPALREAVATDSVRRRGGETSPAQVVVTPGAKPVVALALMALADPGSEVIVPDPGFPTYASMARALGVTPVPLALRAENDFRIDLDALRAAVTPRTRMLVLNSPHNPTGGILDRSDLEAVAAVAMANDIVVLSDEIYGRLAYDRPAESILAIDGMAEHAIVLDGVSKTYAMTGWRLGWAIVPRRFAEPFERLVINTFTGTAPHVQLAAVEALTGPQTAVEEMVAEFRARRSLLVDGLRALPGLDVPMPAGAFYVFPDVSRTGMDGDRFAERLLMEAGVSVLAGSGFGDVGRDHVRISYASSREDLRRALVRMAGSLRSSG